MDTKEVTISGGSVAGHPVGVAAIRATRAAAALLRPLSHRGLWRVREMCLKAGEAFAPGTDVRVRLDRDTEFSFPLSDPYWFQYFAGDGEYEPELARVLLRLADTRYTFIDAGANFGFWSCLVTGERYGRQRAIAVEPSSATFARLIRNRTLNAERFGCVRAALSDRGGEVVHLGGPSHAAMSILSDEGEPVTTATLDGLADTHGIEGPVVIKLDVEGVEIRALAGAPRLLSGNPLVLYEDHGSDLDSRVTAHLLSTGWEVYDIESDVPVRVTDAASLAAVKTDPARGYNFAAFRGGDWLALISPSEV